MKTTWKRIAVLLVVLLAMMMALVLPAAATPVGYSTVLVSAKEPGMTEDGVEYDAYDIVGRYTSYAPVSETDSTASWFKLFDGENYGLETQHRIAAFAVEGGNFNPVADSCEGPGCYGVETLYLAFDIDSRHVPGIVPKVKGQDVVVLDTSVNDAEATEGDFELFFDGSDVNLTKGTEKIDGLDVWTGPFQPADVSLPFDCSAGILFISTKGNYRVTSAYGPALVGDGSDVLIFCATNLGEDTTGFWFRGFDSSELPVKPISSMSGIDIHWMGIDLNGNDTIDVESAMLGFYFTARTQFTAPFVAGGPSEVFAYPDCGGGAFGPLDDLNDWGPALNGTVTGFDIPQFLITSDC
jgi:hypothetical protein